MTEHVCGVGGWGGPKPGDPSNNSALTARGVYGGIELSWSYPSLNPYAVSHFKIYRGITPVFEFAIEIDKWTGTRYFDRIAKEDFKTYFYWIRIVSVLGTEADPIGPASASPIDSIEELISILSGQIDRGLLSESLQTTLDKITPLEVALAQEADNREFLDTAFSGALGSLQTEVTTSIGNLDTLIQTTLFDTSSGVAVKVGELLNQTSLLQAAVDDNAASILEETNARISAIDGMAEQITTVQTNLGDDLATVQQSLSTDIETLDGKVTNIGARYTAVVDVNGLVGGFGVYNNGTTVEAGFNVDTFWVGRTTNKVKPFIIEDGVVYMNSAMINQLTADQIDTRGLTIKDADGNILFGSGTSLNWNHLTGLPTGIFNNNISLAADGTLTGAGGGQVTIAGLGYSGDLAATKNVVTYSATAPVSPTNGDIWVDTSTIPSVTKMRISGAWQIAANLTTDTNQLADGAGLGQTAVWTQVASRPTSLSALNSTDGTKLAGIEAGATVGAPTGTYVGSTLAQNVETNANTAKAAVDDIASDAKFTPVEKSAVKLEWDAIVSEKPVLVAQATTYGLASTAYTNAFQALANYLNAGTAWTAGDPAWLNSANLGLTTDIVGSTFRTTFGAYYDARTALIKAVTDAAGTTASWAGVSGAGKPSDNATKNVVYRQTTAPTSGMTGGDFWIKTNAPYAIYQYDGASWVKAGDLTAENTAAGIANQGAFATVSQLTSGNISTYIAGAAIGSALIANAAIGNAHIGTAAVASANIADAAITNAKIADASITSAKIVDAEVGTLKLAGQAVTIPVSIYTDGAISLGTVNPGTLIQSLTITSTGAPIHIIGTASASGNVVTATSAIMTVRRDGVQVARSAQILPVSTSSYGSLAVSFVETPGVGDHTYDLYMVQSGTSSLSAYGRTLLALETKR